MFQTNVVEKSEIRILCPNTLYVILAVSEISKQMKVNAPELVCCASVKKFVNIVVDNLHVIFLQFLPSQHNNLRNSIQHVSAIQPSSGIHICLNTTGCME
jgi:hypothetical protein